MITLDHQGEEGSGQMITNDHQGEGGGLGRAELESQDT
jgi:hypothetical protein